MGVAPVLPLNHAGFRCAPVFSGYASESVTTPSHLQSNERVVTEHGSAEECRKEREHRCEAEATKTNERENNNIENEREANS